MFRDDPVWMWRDGVPRPPSTVACIDIDGVLADASHRQYHLDYHDWDSFFLAVGEDPVLEPQAAMVRALASEHLIALVTSRPEWVGPLTVGWLEAHDLRWDLLVMRSNGDYRRAPMVKTAAVEQFRDRGFDPVLSVDDDRRNVAAYERAGVPCVYIHSGYHQDD